MKDYSCLRKKCFILLMIILTIVAFCISDYMAKYLRNTSLEENGIWLYYLLLLFPIISIVQLLTSRNKNSKIVSILVVIISFCGLLIFLNGWSSFNSFSKYKDVYHQQILKYENAFSFDFPRFGKLTIKDSSFDGEFDMAETTMIEVQYDNINSIHTFEKRIIKDDKWVKKNRLDKKLNVLASYQLNETDDDCYYLIYNQSTKEFNKLPKVAGKYHFYVALYNINKRMLQINDFDYNYK